MDERNIFSSVSHFSSGATPASPSWWSGCWTPTTPRRASGARPTPPSSRRTRPPGPGSSGSGPRTRTRDPADRSSTPSRRGPTRYLRINSFGDIFSQLLFLLIIAAQLWVLPHRPGDRGHLHGHGTHREGQTGMAHIHSVTKEYFNPQTYLR